MIKILPFVILFLVSSCLKQNSNQSLSSENNYNSINDGSRTIKATINEPPFAVIDAPVNRITVTRGSVIDFKWTATDYDSIATMEVYKNDNFNSKCDTGTLIQTGLIEGTDSNLLIDTTGYLEDFTFLCLVVDDSVNDPVEKWSPKITLKNSGVYEILSPLGGSDNVAANGNFSISWNDINNGQNLNDISFYYSSINSGDCSSGILIGNNILDSDVNNYLNWNLSEISITSGTYYLCMKFGNPANGYTSTWSDPIAITDPVVLPKKKFTFDGDEPAGAVTVTGKVGNSSQWTLGTPGALSAGGALVNNDFTIGFMVKVPKEGHVELDYLPDNINYGTCAGGYGANSIQSVKTITLFTTSGVTLSLSPTGLTARLNWLSGGSNPYSVKMNGAGVANFDYIADNNWHHIVIRRDTESNHVQFFIDGKSNTQMRFSDTNGQLLPSGTILGSSGAKFELDQMIFFDKPLSDSMIYKHFLEVDNYLAYSSTDPNISVPTYDVDISGKIDPLDFAKGHPFYEETVIDQLMNFPKPVYKKNTTLMYNTRLYMPSELLIPDNFSIITPPILTDDEKSLIFQHDLAFFYRTAFELSGGHTALAEPNEVSQLLNAHPEIPLASAAFYIGFAALSHVPPGNDQGAFNHENYNSYYSQFDFMINNSNEFILDAITGEKQLKPSLTNWTAAVTNGESMANGFDGVLDTAMLSRPINLFVENGEYIEGYFPSGYNAGYIEDATVVADFIDVYLNNSTPNYVVFNCNSQFYANAYELSDFAAGGATDKDRVNPDNFTGQQNCELLTLWKLYSDLFFTNAHKTVKEAYFNYDYINNSQTDAPTCDNPTDPWLVDTTSNSCKSVQLRESNNETTSSLTANGKAAYFQFKAAGHNDYGKCWGATRNKISKVNDNRYSNRMYFNTLGASSWQGGMGAFASTFVHQIESFLKESMWGDRFSAPLVNPGWTGYDNGENGNFVPSQYLAVLKASAVFGAEMFHMSNFQNDGKNPVTGPSVDPKFYAWQLAAPPLAQAITSHYEDIFRNGYPITNNKFPYFQLDEGDPAGDNSFNFFNQAGIEASNYTYEVIEGDSLTPVWLRKHYFEDKFVIFTAQMRMSNMKDVVPASKNIKIKIKYSGGSPWEETLEIETRKQGSVYYFDRQSFPTVTMFQLDEWHESTHLSYWSDDIKIEAELFDSVDSGDIITDHNGTAEDYTDNLTYVGNITSGDTLHYNFSNKYTGTTTYYVWIKGQGGASVDITVDGVTNTSAALPGSFGWRLVGSYDLSERKVYELDLTTNGAGIEVDKLHITTDNSFIPAY